MSKIDHCVTENAIHQLTRCQKKIVFDDLLLPSFRVRLFSVWKPWICHTFINYHECLSILLKLNSTNSFLYRKFFRFFTLKKMFALKLIFFFFRLTQNFVDLHTWRHASNTTINQTTNLIDKKFSFCKIRSHWKRSNETKWHDTP